MATPTARDQLIAKLDELSDEQIAALLRYVETMQTTTLPTDYDAASDPAIGFFLPTLISQVEPKKFCRLALEGQIRTSNRN